MEPPPFSEPPSHFQEWFDIAIRTYRNRGRALSTVAWFALVCVATVVAVTFLSPESERPKARKGASATQPESATVAATTITVHVAGEVNQPGVFRLRSDQRVIDAINKAGGETTRADIQQLNLAAKLVDGSRIYVPKKGETLSESSEGQLPGSASAAGPISLSSASQGQLEELPGVGPATATAIIKYRETNGPFRSVEDLLDVPGIGDAKLENLRDLVTP